MRKFAVVFVILLAMIATVACGASPSASAAEPSAFESSITESSPEVTPTSDALDSASPSEEIVTTDYKKIGEDLIADESLGPIKIGMKESDLITAIGQPDIKATPSVSASDNKKHTDWAYQVKGLRINMIEGDNSRSEYIIFSISAFVPCDFETKKGIKIGDSEEKVFEEYGYAIEDNVDVTSQNTIVVGSIYGGLLFNIKSGQVTLIFIGKAA